MKDTSVLSLLENERKETRRALENIMKAIESGIFNTTTQTRMNELEKQLTDIEDKIELEKNNKQKILTKEKVMTYLTNAILKKPKTLIHTLTKKSLSTKTKSKSITITRTKQIPGTTVLGIFLIGLVRIVPLYWEVIQQIRTKMKRTTRKVRIVPLWWTETTQIRTYNFNFRISGFAQS